MPSLHLLISRQTPRPSEVNNPTATRSSSSIPFYTWIIVALILLAILAIALYFLYSSLRARRLGLPQPSFNPFARSSRSTSDNFSSSSRRRQGGGVLGKVQDGWSSLTNKISGGGGAGYTGPAGGRTRGTFGALDPDEAWDAVGAEADYGYSAGGGGYDEQELGLRSAGDGAHGNGYAAPGGLESIETGRDSGERARKGARDLEDRYEEEMHGGRAGEGERNPFGDEEESSLRGVSPRPDGEGRRGHGRDGSGGGRFREDM